MNADTRIQKFVPGKFENYSFEGFFEGWGQSAPDLDGFKEILSRSYCSFVAIDNEARRIIGFVNCISDGVLSCFIPLLEVLPQYRRQGIGNALLTAVFKELEQFYMVDLICDDKLVSFYERQGLLRSNAMIMRNYRWNEAKRS